MNNHLAAAEERLVSERLKQKLNYVNTAAQNQLSCVTDHVNFTLQQGYFKCAYECFDRRRKYEEISNCVENCSIPVMNANQLVETEMAKFQEMMNRSLMVCQDKFEQAKLQQIKTGAINEMESCVDRAIQDSVKLLPHVVDRLKTTLNISRN
ncbi:hypothetical protein C5167_025976 [Papaver somniferum]|uniref:Protein FAM136A n=1 Tax=Papaver somniferum TaxID=3469 RepID=A0A4Y7JWR6_PAPSO|nr:protein FAM136A-like [Papaver somniferum]RZC64208.1 hypothetical protein C5167_025976 [Papaver somniferum]